MIAIKNRFTVATICEYEVAVEWYGLDSGIIAYRVAKD